MTHAVHVYSGMTRTMMSGAARGLGLAALLVSAAGCTVQLDGHAFIEREEKRFPAGEAPEITLATFAGSIQVRPWDKAEVLVEIEKRGSDKAAVDGIQVVADGKDNRISVDVRKPASEKEFIGLGIHHSTSAKLIASVPRGSKLTVTTRDGAVVVRAERDTVMLEDWSVRTGDGSVVVELPEGFAAQIDAETQDGTVRTDLPVSGASEGERRESRRTLRGTLGAGGKTLKLRTSDGSIRLRSS